MINRRGDRRTDSSTVGTFVTAIVIVASLTIAAIVGLMVLRPEADNSQAITVLVGLVTPIIGVLLGLIQRENHLAMNSRLDQVITLTGAAQRAEGVIEGASAKVVSGPLLVPSVQPEPPAKP